MNWRKTYTDINNVNNGQEFENSDYPTKEAFNVALNNTAYLKQNQDSQANSISNIEQRLNDLGFKQGYFNAFITYEDSDPDTGETYEVTEQISSSDISTNTLTREGNRFIANFRIDTPILLNNYHGGNFKKFALEAHGQGVSDNYFKFAFKSIYGSVNCDLIHRYQNNVNVDMAIIMNCGFGSPYNKIEFDRDDLTFAFDGTNFTLQDVQGINILNIGLEAR